MHHDQPELFLGIQGWFNIPKATSVVQNINKLKKKNYAISSVDTGKAMDQIQHLCPRKEKSSL